MFKKYKIVSLFFAILIIVSTVLFTSFNAKEINHECQGEDCPICCQISSIKDVVNNKVLSSALVVSVISFIFYKFIGLYKNNLLKQKNTLFSLKVELLN